MGEIELHVFGHVDLTSSNGGDPDALVAQPKRFALLCYLAIPKPGTMFRRDTLLGVFWPEGDFDRARTALRQALARIRRTLGDEVIVRRGSDEVGLNPGIFWCDVAEFEQACCANDWGKAAELYKGELLRGLFLSKAVEFEHWLDSERARLSSHYANALLKLAQDAATVGRYREAVEWWQALVRHDPFDSHYVSGLMAALNRAGDPAHALIYAKKHRELLKAELDITLPAEIKAIVHRMRSERSDKAAIERPARETSPMPDSSYPVPREKHPVAEDIQPRETAASRGEVLFWQFLLAAITVFSVGLLLANMGSKSRSKAPVPTYPTSAVFTLGNLGPPEHSGFPGTITDALTTRRAPGHGIRIGAAHTGYHFDRFRSFNSSP